MSAHLHPGGSHWQWSCGLCNKDHALKTCPKFLNASADERFDVVQIKGYCTNCLARSHRVQDCKNEFGCRVCTKRHNTLLHDAPQLKQPSHIARSTKVTKNRPIITQTTQATQTVAEMPFSWPNVFIPTVTVKIAARRTSENWAMVRAIIDTSKTVSTIATSTANRHKLKIEEQHPHKFATFHMRSRNAKMKFSLEVKALLTDTLPRRPYLKAINDNPYEEFSEDTLADIDPRANSFLELELGGDIYPQIRRDGAIELEMGHVVAQRTVLGYTFSGPTKAPY